MDSTSHESTGLLLRMAVAHTLERARDIQVLVVCNTKSRTRSGVGAHHAIQTEFYSDSELSELLVPIRESRIEVLGVVDEEEFYDRYGGHRKDIADRSTVVVNFGSARTGPWGKTLVPAIADAAGLISTNSDPYAIALARHKAHGAYVIGALGLCDSRCWFYDPVAGWLAGLEPPEGTEVIIMPAFESASIGITAESKRVVDRTLASFVQELAHEFSQGIVVRPFVPGLEIECPIVTGESAFSLPPMSISFDGSGIIGDEFLTYDDVYNDRYSFSPLCEIVPPGIIKQVSNAAVAISRAFGLRGFSRVDFRLSHNGQLMATDVSASPHFISHSSFAASAHQLGVPSGHLILSLIGLALIRHASPV